MPEGKPEVWTEGSHTLRIESWYSRGELAILPTWYQGYVDGLRVAQSEDYDKVKARTQEEARRRTKEPSNGNE